MRLSQKKGKELLALLAERSRTTYNAGYEDGSQGWGDPACGTSESVAEKKREMVEAENRLTSWLIKNLGLQTVDRTSPYFCQASPSGKHSIAGGIHSGFCDWCSEEVEQVQDASRSKKAWRKVVTE